ncbi:MAG TPA: DUF5618 family protein [Niabella sp.]|jgi:hypothetical protein|nr:DUF5618 family protein [Chitinophagaceae bacterium]HRN48702.1 DUF5618 family protein [Niabella sp.]HUN02905.1 DUF5618 family protein [Niabella sp.]
MKENEHIKEAERFIANAKEILTRKAKKKDGYYTDAKYVKMAGHTAYTGVLVALDGALGIKTKGRKTVDWYKQNIAKKHKKLLYPFLAVYDTLHLSMGYDGNPNAAIAQSGLSDAEKIINALAV